MMRVFIPLCLSLLLLGCSEAVTFEGECKRDSDCEEYQRCDLLDYRCICDSGIRPVVSGVALSSSTQPRPTHLM